jgi:uncharacterized OsmC-like protein
MGTDEGSVVNGLNIGEFREAVKTVAEQEGAQHAPKKARVQWMGGFKFSALTRNHTFVIDEPAHLTGEDEAPNSMEYVLGAYGACLATGFVLNASLQGVTIRNMEIALDAGQDNVFTFLGLGGKGHSGFSNVNAKLYVQAEADAETLQHIWEKTVETSPVGNSLVHNVVINPAMDVIP